MIIIEDTNELSDEEGPEKEILVSQNIKSLICLPIQINGEPFGLLGIDAVYKKGNWDKEQISSFYVLSTVMADILLKNITESKLQNINRLQDIVMNLSTSFINIPLNEIDNSVEKSLSDIGNFVDADRAYIFRYNEKKTTVSNSHEWCNDGISPHIQDLQDIPLSVVGDWYETHMIGNPVIINDVSKLPESHEQKKILDMQDIKSVVAFPLISKGEYLGFVGFDSVKKKHLYSDKEINILNVFAQMLVNVIERQRMQSHLIASREEADRSNKAKSIFLANMSHELRTPLNGVIGFLDMLNHTNLTSEQYRYIISAMKSAESLMSIINDILDLSKVEAGKLELEEEETNLHDLIQQSVDIIRYSANKKGLMVNINISDNVPLYAIVDPLRLKQILVNLVGNAVKFTKKGKVDLSLRFKKDVRTNNTGYFTFEVLDTGIGISEDKKDKLFKAFSQLDSTFNREYGGTGLGLIISNMLAKKMGSVIEFESKLSVGSRFYFTIKSEYLNQEDVQGLSQKEEHKKAIANPNLKPVILIVEDTDLNRILVKTLIKKIYPKATVFEAVNGEEAITKYTEKNPDIILMDIQMPVLNGFEATRKIREIEKDSGKHVHIVALTASVTSEAEEKCLEYGMDYYIAKPFRDVQIKSVIDRFVISN